MFNYDNLSKKDQEWFLSVIEQKPNTKLQQALAEHKKFKKENNINLPLDKELILYS